MLHIFTTCITPGFVLVVLALLFSDTANAQEMPGWLNEGEESVVPPPVARSREAREEREERTIERRPSGPFLEEFSIDPPTESVQSRRASTGPKTEESEDLSIRTERGSRYQIQPSDVLVVSVWREPDLLREVTVSPDGWITFPLAGELYVEGSTVSVVREEIEGKIRRYINRAAVNVTLKQTLGNRVYVLGKVNNPGVFPFSKKLNVMQALSLAGGVSKFAATDDIRIIRETEESQTSFKFNYAQIRRGRQLSQNILLRSGDVVMVP